ncbi:GAF domain-containing protein [Oscillatoria sp. FACHB-1406]|uniref:GAF domain-containing protein n=1 Tax=Oscillatoria sp. FACHB-1406 TaxID=2692846 RepID=UPI00168770DC|nr:GAF domain-containing protein [Oscillatoria sp. FACHB-1406]MBD2580010.1 GAF domain-containing protein [Oscillatoria sp. FACHB-1406]
MISPAAPTPSPNEDSPSGVLLAKGLTEKSTNYKKLIAAVLGWTGKEPFLTQMLCKLIVDAPDKPSEGGEGEWVDNLVRSQWLENWESRDELKSLRATRDRLRQPKPRSIKMLQLYREILQQGEIAANNSAEQKELQLLGLVAKQGTKLRVHNWIQASIFNLEWVENTLENLHEKVESSDAEFVQGFAELERKLLIAQVDILAQTDRAAADDSSVAQTLYEVLRDVTAKVGEILAAERTTIFLLNEDKTELWSLVAQGQSGEFLDIQLRIGEGIAGQVAAERQIIHIPDNVYSDPRSQLVKEFDKKYNYQTNNILAFPILDDHQELIAVIQLLNKVPQAETAMKGFTVTDIERLAKCVVPIRRILEICQSAYAATKKVRATAALAEATRSLDSLDLADATTVLQTIMQAAKKLMNADRSTLWLVDRDRGELWTELPQKVIIRCPIGVGFAGKVAETRKPTIIPFDLYDNPHATNAKKTDEKTRYRTCSLLCMPVFGPDGELLGVTQLVNKRKPGTNLEYDPVSWPMVPDYFKASFDKNDRQSMQVFNERVGAILNYVRTHQAAKRSAEETPRETFYQALVLLSEAIAFRSTSSYETLYAWLELIGTALRQAVNCEAVTIFLFDRAARELGTLVADSPGDAVRETIVPCDRGFAARVLADRSVRLNNNLDSDPAALRSEEYQTVKATSLHHILLFPFFDSAEMPVAIIRFLNKLNDPLVAGVPLSEQIDPEGFLKADARLLHKHRENLLPLLLACQTFYSNIRQH